MNIISPKGKNYSVGKALGETTEYSLYECTLESGQKCILKIATTVEKNHFLDREAYILDEMYKKAKLLEEEYAKVKEDEAMLNYQFCFPYIIESFIAIDQGNRRINILSFFEIAKDLSDLVPILHIVTRDKSRVDPKTSAWILGKLLKLIGFTHSLGIENGKLTGDNILINRERHIVAIFDWSQAIWHSERMPEATVAQEISQIAKEVVFALGGDPDTGDIPEDEQMGDDQYPIILKKLIKQEIKDADQAHKIFYELIRGLWPRKFHPYTAYKL